MEDVVQIENRWYILAGSSLVDQRTLVLKDGQVFGVFNLYGDLEAFASGQGLFSEGMRFLSRLETRLNGRRPLLLSSAVSTDNTTLLVDLTNPDQAVPDASGAPHGVPHGAVHVQRTRNLRAGACFERITAGSFDDRAPEAVLSLTFDADFADIFEIRGMRRTRHGQRMESSVSAGRVVRLGYQGLDGIKRYTVLEFDPPPELLTVSHARYRLDLRDRRRHEIHVTIRCEPAPPRVPVSFAESRRELNERIDAFAGQTARITTTNQQLNRWLGRSLADIRMLTSDLETGPYPFAGIPWYSCPFGRDAIITAMQMLWVMPSLAKGVLSFCAATQATGHDPAHDAEPGKIFHEWRTDEMANIGEVPFGRYYGTVDATPLFIMLAGAYFRTTRDRELIGRLWPNVVRALDWIDVHGDEDHDGFVEYRRKGTDGLANQGWKDSYDSVFHADGSLAKAPIALCEVQGYVYAAKSAAAVLARVVGEYERAENLENQARILKARFHEFFWSDELGFYALALDGKKEPCLVRSSNPGHCLWTGIADERVARRMARVLLGHDLFSGWGIRTVAHGEARYNPMSYHNGSVWPHDTAISALGLSRYGLRHQPRLLLAAWMQASGFLNVHRLPELICGFRRQPGNAPTEYPVACTPQAWASGSAFMLLEACLGLEIDAPRRVLKLRNPVLPASVREILLSDLRVGDACLDLLFHREHEDVGVLVKRREGEVAVQVEK